jgi:hypothetical protein
MQDALTKELELTQHLMELFTTYQVPADLISFDGKKVTLCNVCCVYVDVLW